MQEPLILLLAAAYVAGLFAVAYYADEQAGLGRSVINSPVVYALSLAVYCTAWTFYGSVGRAATTGLGFLPIYLGPTLMAILGWVVLRKMLRISKHHRITSIADFIGSRYGKSAVLAGTAALVAVLGVVPYLALQLKAISASYLALSGVGPVPPTGLPLHQDTAFWTAVALALFTILFGTRYLDVTERHEGIVAAIAFESVVKLAAFLAVGLYVTFGLYDGFDDLFRAGAGVPSVRALYTIEAGSAVRGEWFWLTGLSMLAVLLLPRQFQVGVVENVDEDHLRTASWLFPLYLLAINLFVLPIAVAGRLQFGSAANADAFMLTLPLAGGNDVLAFVAFLGGFSAGTGMVIVAATALTTMICNDLVVPALLRIPALRLAERDRLAGVILGIRRGGIVVILLLAYGYVRYFGHGYSLVSIGLISFAAVAQFAPAVLGGMYWKRGTRLGAMSGLVAGFLIWGYTLPLPSLVDAGWLSSSFVTQGPFGWSLLQPYALFGMAGLSPIPHALFWSLLANTALYLGVSLSTRPGVVEQSQAAQFVDVFAYAGPVTASMWRSTAPLHDLRALLNRYLGQQRTEQALARYAERRNLDMASMEEADEDLLHYAEQLLAGVLGAASARVATGSIVREKRLRIEEVMEVLDEAQQTLAYSRELENRRRELQRATRELRAANEALREVDRRKDEFVSTVSHELQTPLAAIRANAELLRTHPTLDTEQRRAFLDLILREAGRLSRLVDQVLDLERLDATADAVPADEPVDVAPLLAAAAEAVRPSMAENDVTLSIDTRHNRETEGNGLFVQGTRDRLLQVFLNVLSNAAKYADRRARVTVWSGDGFVDIRVSDDGPGIHPDDRPVIFDRFRQGRANGPQPGSGLGLAIARQIVERQGGAITVDSRRGEGATFQIRLPRYRETDETESGEEDVSSGRDGRGIPPPSPESSASSSARSSSSAGPGP